mmetsp:Transcript_20365/g.52585  ORF Transcript_20365/g.52585 Transcript_20365/m.52585 type:complete len:495 (+) Transcript_20365:1142-2626(+)
MQWGAPHANGADVSHYQLQWSGYSYQTVRSCAWTGPSCGLSCGQLGHGNWTEEATRLAPMWEHCAGANLVGCCGPYCWCYDRRCCAPRTDLAEVPFAHEREVPAPPSEPMAWARISAGAEGPGHVYTVRVRARNAYGYSDWSRALTVPTDAHNASAPAAVRAPLFRAASDALWLAWEAAEPHGAALLAYELRVLEAHSHVDSVPSLNDGVVHALPPTATTHVLEGLLPSSLYTVAVRARNSHGAAPWSPPITAVTRPLSPPAAPVDVVIEQRFADALTLAWPRAMEPTASVLGYEVEWAPMGAEGSQGSWSAGCAVERAPAAGAERDGAEGGGDTDAAGASASGPGSAGDVEHPRCTIVGLPPRTNVAVRARARSLAGWGPHGHALPAYTRVSAACGTVADQRTTFAQSFADQLQTCSSDCWGQPPCTTHCLQGLTLSEACAECFATAVGCSKSTCRSSCSWNSRSDACHECTADQCLPALSQCAGADTPAGVL